MDTISRNFLIAEIILGVAILCAALALSFSGTRLPTIAVVATVALALVLMRYVVRPLVTKSRDRQS